MFVFDAKLEQWATERQWELYCAIRDNNNSISAASDKLGLSRSTIQDAIKAIKKKAVQHGYAPENSLIHPVPDGMRSAGPSILFNGEGQIEGYWNKMRLEGLDPDDPRVKKLLDPKKTTKISTLTDAVGNVTQQWVTEKPEDIFRELLWEQFAKQMAVDLPRLEPVPGPKVIESDLCLALPVGDHHLGMHSWKKETGEDYDLKISENLLMGAVQHLIDNSPKCDTIFIPFLGDLAHYDGFKPVTPAHGNLLDADSRFPKMVETLVRMIRRIFDLALTKANRVHAIFEIGNHDPATTIFLQIMMAALYEKEPRITIDTSPMHYHYFRWGNVLVGTHHGHGAKPASLPGIMAFDRREDWGQTEYHYWWTGHIHHDSAKDYVGCKVESMRVLATDEAYAHQKGYRAARDMKAIGLHKQFGEVFRNIVNPAMF